MCSQSKQEVFYVKGAPEVILQKCTKFSYRGTELALDKNHEQEFLAEAFEVGRKGLRGNV